MTSLTSYLDFRSYSSELKKGYVHLLPFEIIPNLDPFKSLSPEAILNSLESPSWVGSKTSIVMVMNLIVYSGPQSRQTPKGCVTALLLVPNHGGIIAPKPPAGPPAAMTNK